LFSLKFKDAFIKEIISFLWEAESKASKVSESLSINLVGFTLDFQLETVSVEV